MDTADNDGVTEICEADADPDGRQLTVTLLTLSLARSPRGRCKYLSLLLMQLS